MNLIILCLISYFQLDGQIYQQLRGMPMGSPLSGFIAVCVSRNYITPMHTTKIMDLVCRWHLCHNKKGQLKKIRIWNNQRHLQKNKPNKGRRKQQRIILLDIIISSGNDGKLEIQVKLSIVTKCSITKVPISQPNLLQEKLYKNFIQMNANIL